MVSESASDPSFIIKPACRLANTLPDPVMKVALSVMIFPVILRH